MEKTIKAGYGKNPDRLLTHLTILSDKTVAVCGIEQGKNIRSHCYTATLQVFDKDQGFLRDVWLRKAPDGMTEIKLNNEPAIALAYE